MLTYAYFSFETYYFISYLYLSQLIHVPHRTSYIDLFDSLSGIPQNMEVYG